MQLGWIDFSKEDRQKALDVINLLSEQGAVDELGIGIIRDAFANYFFPGTSTIQTRAKYAFNSPMRPFVLATTSIGQEELLEYLFKEFKDTSGLKKLFIDLSPFSKGKEG